MIVAKKIALKWIFKAKIFTITLFSMFFLSLAHTCFSLNEIKFNAGDIIIREEQISKKDLKNTFIKQRSNAFMADKNTIFIQNKGIIKGNFEMVRDNIYYQRNDNPNLDTLNSFLYFPIDCLESGNGVYSANTFLVNRGIITGSSSLVTKNIDIPINNAAIIGFLRSQLSGNGIIGGKEIVNTGILAGDSRIYGSKIISEDTPQVIQASLYSRISGNGVYTNNSLSENSSPFLKNNTGIIRGQSIIQGGFKDKNSNANIHSKQSGNGIYIKNTFQDSFNKNIKLDKNSGIIKGFNSLVGEIIDVSYSLTGYSSVSTYSQLSGNGISIGEDTISTPKDFISDNENASIISGDITLLENSGIISGKTFIQGGKITNLSGNNESYNNYAYIKTISSGNGISSNNLNLDLNKGIISGEAVLNGGKITISSPEYFDLNSNLYSETSGNGIQGNKNINLNLNQGIISGNITVQYSNVSEESNTLVQSGNGINGGSFINNEGTISGYAMGNNNFESGNGIVLSLDGGTITNKGIIKGSNFSITTSEIEGNSEEGISNNYGILAGKNIFAGNIKNNNFGIYVTGNDNLEKVEIAPSGAIINGKEVINADNHHDHINVNDTYFKIKDSLNYNNNIINGVGVESGTLTVENDSILEVSNSIVNSYKTSVTLKDSSNFIANNSIFNGGGLKNTDSVIESNGNNIKIRLENNSIVNGNISLNGSNSELNISNKAQINGNLLSNGTNNSLLLGNIFFPTSDSLIIYKKINGFDSISTKGSIFLSSEASIDKGIITIKKGSTLVIALDGTSRDNNNYVIGHALYNHTGEIILDSPNKYTGLTPNLDDNAQIIFKASGLGENTIIAMNGTDVSSINDYYLGTTSIVHTARKLNDAEGNIIISVKNFDEIFKDEKPNGSDNTDFTPLPDDGDRDKDKPPVTIPDDGDKDKDKPPITIPDEEDKDKVQPPVTIPDDGDKDKVQPPITIPDEEDKDKVQPPITIPDEEDKDKDKPPVTIPDDGDRDKDKPPVTIPDEEDKDKVQPPVTIPDDGDKDKVQPPVTIPDEEDKDKDKPPVTIPDDGDKDKVQPPVTIPDEEDKEKVQPPVTIPDDSDKDKDKPKTEIDHRTKIKEVYDGIKDSKQIPILSPTTDSKYDSKLELISLLNQIYANNPYAFVGEASKEAIDLFRTSHQYIPIPEQGDYVVSGSAISSYSNYKDVTMDNTIDDKNSNNSYSRNTKTFGGLGDIEYGLGRKSSIGFLIGGANQKVNMSHNSNLDGDILYLGTYHRKEAGKYIFETGFGYQYASYDVTRSISNKYQKIENNGDVDSNSIIVYEDIRYLLEERDGWKFEPKLSLTAVHVNQNSAKEKKSDFSMNIDSQTYNYFDTEIGIEVTKEIPLESGKLKSKGSLSYINSQGPSEKELSANFSQGGEKFDILGPELSTNNCKIGVEVTYEQLSGIDYFIGIDYKVGEGKKNTTYGKIGINYKL